MNNPVDYLKNFCIVLITFFTIVFVNREHITQALTELLKR